VLAVIVGVGFTVMVNVTGVPGQLAPCAIKLPTELGNVPTAIVDVTVLVPVLTTETLFDPWFTTYKKLPSALSATPIGSVPAVMVDITVRVVVFTTETELIFAVYNRLPSALTATPTGSLPTPIVATIALVDALITATVLEF